jgi:Zn-dependent protease with chaperone function
MKHLWLILFVIITQVIIFSQNKVEVNTKTGRIHIPGVLHLPDLLYQKEYDNKELAVTGGFDFCNACFDIRPEIYDYDLEKQLTTQAIVAIKNNYEIMYEHERLEFLSELMSNILKRWPEPLKGYSYRLQVIRSESPNALAIAGGNLYLTTGLIDMVENDAELEAVLVHEIAHVERRHTLKSFKEYQKKQLGVKAVALFMTTLSVASGNPNVEILSQLTKMLTEYSMVLAVKGYSRELEMEADMFAQLYFQENELDKINILTVFDRLATYSSTRLGYIPGSNAFSDHPAILQRMKQIETGHFYRYNTPLKLTLNPIGILRIEETPKGPQKKVFISTVESDLLSSIDSGFITIEIDKYYSAESSDSPGMAELIFLGKIYNHDKNRNYTINKINFIIPYNIISKDGFVDISVGAGKEADFFGRIKVKGYLKQIEEAFKNKDIAPYLISISPINMSNNKTLEKSFWDKKIMCDAKIE